MRNTSPPRGNTSPPPRGSLCYHAKQIFHSTFKSKIDQNSWRLSELLSQLWYVEISLAMYHSPKTKEMFSVPPLAISRSARAALIELIVEPTEESLTKVVVFFILSGRLRVSKQLRTALANSVLNQVLLHHTEMSAPLWPDWVHWGLDSVSQKYMEQCGKRYSYT